VLRAQQIPAAFHRWQFETLPAVEITSGSIKQQDSTRLDRADYRHEGLIFGGVALGALGAWVGSRISAACPLDIDGDCGTNRVENGVVLGLAGAAIGGGVGYLIGRFSPKRPPRAVVVPQAPPHDVGFPDSVRLRTGYQHWKGTAIGTGAGAVLGAIFALAAGTGCSDCTITTADRMGAALVVTGAGGLVGFLAGLASPKYIWVQREIPTNPVTPKPER
jgi:hypothetical protein